MRRKKTLERKLIQRARDGEQAAFEDLVRPYREPLYWRAVKALDDPDAADDVVQETFIRAYTRLDTFRGDSRFGTWLFTIGSICIRMHLRRRQRKGANRIEDHLFQVEQESAQSPEARAVQPDRLVIHSELTGALDEAISQLPPQYGSILRLWVEDGLDLNEIQAHSGLSVSAIKSRLHRARRRIKAVIEARFGPGALMPA
jgi:RNA polymerase sigma-70 factor (ECF subfamily)